MFSPYMSQGDNDLNKRVEDWWNSNPFTCGTASDQKNDLTGRLDHFDQETFERIERRMRKWWIGVTYTDPTKPLLSSIFPYEALCGKRVLDIAVGTGWSSVEMARYAEHVTGIDLTEEAIRISAIHADVEGVKNVTFQKMDAQHLSFTDESFDFALAWGCHMHMPNTESSLAEVCRVLKPGSMTVAYWYNKSSWTYWFNFFFLRGVLLGRLLKYKGNMTRIVSRYTDGSSKGGNALTKAYSPADLERMYVEAGFTSVWTKRLPLKGEVEGWPAAKFPIFRFLPASWRSWLGARFAWGQVVLAWK